MAKNCRGCKYWRSLYGCPNSMKVCHYMLDTGESRGDPAENCTKKETARKSKQSEKRNCMII